GGGGVPASGRSASLAVFGTIGFGACGRSPNSPSAGLVFMAPQYLFLRPYPPNERDTNLVPDARTLGSGRIRQNSRRNPDPGANSTVVTLEDQRGIGAAKS